MKCNDLRKNVHTLTFAAFQNKILHMKQNCYKYKLRLMKKLGNLLIFLIDLLKDHEESPFRGTDL